MAIDQVKLEAFMGNFVHDFGAVMHAATVVVGDKLGLYKALTDGPLSADGLAKKTGTDARYVREWLSAQAASGYVQYDPATDNFSLTEEQAFALTVEDGPAFIPGAFEFATAHFSAIPKMIAVFQTGEGFGWHQHDAALFRGTERFFRPGYAANLVKSWIPSLEGVEHKLKAGAQVADVGCGHGASTIIMAQAYPNATFAGFDYHEPSIRYANDAAARAGVADRVHFEVASSTAYPGKNYDLVTFFDCLHDMGNPIGASSHVLKSLGPDGTWMVVEPFANDRLEENLNPVGRIFYSASSFICTPASRSQDGAMCLGAQAGEKRIREAVMQGGFTRFRRATETPFNLVYEARP
ncbi:class I SAM-dependent methyltransferase [Terriglobus saanensis]|uniref:Methyltransferase type 12 n=1 Tax=Terriglobus saanensis (strain ATCC BAA-1853 / DSM 23119 / SP1PR4) TaxID=401053 RepID=E8V8G0_TERSS|nr:class I SAM-dependent methyltransferase [Terriglobus saanensis]ADV82939.1 Methyltransferase type 12 [Terriglobus saanensis SP1PR4]